MLAWNAFCRFVKKTNKISLYIAVACVLCMALLLTVEITGRTFLGKSTLIADEYSGYLLCALTMFGGAYALEHGAFLRVDIVYDHFSNKLKRFADLFNCFVALAYSCMMLRFCFGLFYSNVLKDTVSSFVSRTPLIYPQSAMVIGWILLTLQIIVEMGNTIGWSKKSSGDEEGAK